jgi:hypothetical protein
MSQGVHAAEQQLPVAAAYCSTGCCSWAGLTAFLQGPDFITITAEGKQL